MPKRIDVPTALAMMDELRSWTCDSCDTMIEDGHPGPHCRRCAQDWQDEAWGGPPSEDLIAAVHYALSAMLDMRRPGDELSAGKREPDVVLFGVDMGERDVTAYARGAGCEAPF